MHIIKQLSEDEFVIKMDDYDLRKHDVVRIAHDYVQFSGKHICIQKEIKI